VLVCCVGKSTYIEINASQGLGYVAYYPLEYVLGFAAYFLWNLVFQRRKVVGDDCVPTAQGRWGRLRSDDARLLGTIVFRRHKIVGD